MRPNTRGRPEELAPRGDGETRAGGGGPHESSRRTEQAHGAERGRLRTPWVRLSVQPFVRVTGARKSWKGMAYIRLLCRGSRSVRTGVT